MSENIEEFIHRYPEYLDEIAEASDHLGTMQGVAFTKLRFPHESELIDVVQFVFDHGIVDIRRDNLKCIAIRTMVRIDEITVKKEQHE